MQAVPFLEKNPDGNTLVLCGDAPFIDSETIKESLELHVQQKNSVTVITAELDNPFGYGRILRTENGISGIVEQKDADENQQNIREVNSGAYWFNTADLMDFLKKLTNSNSQNEYYLTDTVEIAVKSGKRAGAYKSSNPDVILGANDRRGLLELNTKARMNVIDRHIENGVEFTCLDGVTIERSVKIGAGTEILAGTILRGNTVIGENCTIGPNCVIEDCVIGDEVKLNYVQAFKSEIEKGVKIGPWVHIRPGSLIQSGVQIGDLKSKIQRSAKRLLLHILLMLATVMSERKLISAVVLLQ